MVGIFVELIKLSKLHMNAQEMTDLLLNGFLSTKNAYCRTCKSKDIHVYRDYSRWVVEYHNGQIVETKLKTKRFICNTCHHTHAFLVSLIIPYSTYSLLTVLWCLFDYYSHHMTVQKVCEKYHISVPTLYRWKKLFRRDKNLWLTELKDVETGEIEFLKYLLNIPDFQSFTQRFKEMIPDHRCFLQCHKNARAQRYA